MRKQIIHKICLFIIIAYLSICDARPFLPKTNNVPGGVVSIPISQTNTIRPLAFFNHNRVVIIPFHRKWTAVVGIPLTAKPGIVYLTVKKTNRTKKIPLKIKPKKYPNDFIIIKNKRLVTPIKSDLKRIRREQEIINKALHHWSARRDINMHFIWPVKGRISTPFGLHRFYNGQLRSQHSGIDIAASLNTPIRAPADGIVIKTGDYFFMGKAILIDHGQGLISVYCHLNKIFVKANKRVKQGQIIGEVGRTGRATGPHLHWGIRLNNTPVNPELFVGGGL